MSALQINILERNIMHIKPSVKPILTIKFPTDLRMHLDVKTSITKANQAINPSARWTAFINNTGTLCHIVNEDGILIRLKFKSSIKHLSEAKMRAEITFRLNRWIKLI